MSTFYVNPKEDKNRVLQALPGLGAIAGGTYGYRGKSTFHPEAWFGEGKTGLTGKWDTAASKAIKANKGLTPSQRQTKLQSIATKGSGRTRALSALIGAGFGATTGWLPSAVADTGSAIFKGSADRNSAQDIRGRVMAQYMWDELEKIAVEENTEQQSSQMEQGEGEEREKEESPIQGLAGTQILQEGAKRGRGIPVLDPPPGYMFNPELQSFVPDENMAGWMSQGDAENASALQGAYQQGQQDTKGQVAQEEVDRGVAQQSQQMQVEQQQGQMQQEQQQAQHSLLMQKAMKGAPQTPQGVAGAATPLVQEPKIPGKSIKAATTPRVSARKA
jgi:hypothetical protein